jgi:5-methyltetrahydropteroyltriglutamate--homocysteine methyltransferase
MLFPTSLVGSYPQPDWLIDRERLGDRFPPRVRARELWRVDQAYLAQAQQDATLLAIRAQEQAGLDIVTDGEMCRESYSNRFATALDGVDIDNPGIALDRSGHPNPVPRVTGPIRRRHPVETADVTFLRANSGRTIKITVPGPFTMAQPIPGAASCRLRAASSCSAKTEGCLPRSTPRAESGCGSGPLARFGGPRP